MSCFALIRQHKYSQAFDKFIIYIDMNCFPPPLQTLTKLTIVNGYFPRRSIIVVEWCVLSLTIHKDIFIFLRMCWIYLFVFNPLSITPPVVLTCCVLINAVGQ